MTNPDSMSDQIEKLPEGPTLEERVKAGELVLMAMLPSDKGVFAHSAGDDERIKTRFTDQHMRNMQIARAMTEMFGDSATVVADKAIVDPESGLGMPNTMGVYVTKTVIEAFQHPQIA